MKYFPSDSSSPTVMQTLHPSADTENLTPSRLNKIPSSIKSKSFRASVVKSPGSLFSSPVLKRYKPSSSTKGTESAKFEYPQNIGLPDKALIRAFYESAVAQDDSHQSQLDAAASGLLSLEDVLLPAIARHETNALKQIQAKAQRDASDDVVEAIKQCRVAICDCTESAIRAVRQARLEREALHSKHLEELAQEREMQREKRRLEREEELERRRQERAKAREEERERKRREMKKTLPKNVELWKEVAFLMTELAKMSKEEKLWQEIDKKLDEKAKEIETTKNEIQNKAPVPDADESDKIDEEYQERVDNAVEDINLSALRIQRALQLVSEAVAEADGVRSDLFQKYIHDHQFHGYAGVNDPKALIRMLSQD